MKKKILFIFILLILVAGGAFAYVYLKTDLLKSNNELFGKYLVDSYSQLENVFGTTYLGDLNDLNKISAKVTAKAEDIEHDINVEAKVNKDSKIFALTGDYDIYEESEKTDYFDISVLLDDMNLGIKSDALDKDKYVAVSLTKISDILKTYITDTSTIEALEKNDIWDETSTVSNNEEEIIKPYKQIITDYIAGANITKEDFEENILGTNRSGYKVSLNSSVKDLLNLYSNLGNTFINDSNFEKILSLETTDDDGNKVTIKQQIQDTLDQVKEALNSDEEELDDVYTASIYVSKMQTVKMTISDESHTAIEIDYYIDGQVNKAQMTLITAYDEKYIVYLENQVSGNESQANSVLTANITSDEGTEYEETSSYTINSSLNNGTYSYSFDIKPDDETQISSTISLSRVEFESDKITSDTAIILTDLGEDNLESTVTGIMTNFTKFITENPNSLIADIYNSLTALSSFGSSGSMDYSYSDSGTLSFDDDEESVTDLILITPEETKEAISSEISSSLEYILTQYQAALETDSSTNVANYLTEENIKLVLNAFNSKVQDLKFIDGNTISCTYDGSTYYAVINISSDYTVSVTVYSDSEVTIQN